MIVSYRMGFYMLVAITVVLLVVYHLTRNNTETLDPAKRYAGDAKSDISAVDVQLRHKLHQEAIEPDNLDEVFYPAPPVTPRVQSVQYEHIQERELWFDLDYQQKYNFNIIAPTAQTIEAYQQATRNQLEYMRTWLVTMFGPYISSIDMTVNTFNSPVNALMDDNDSMIKRWRAIEVRIDLLISRQKKLSDDAFDDTARMLMSKGLIISPDGHVKAGGAVPTSLRQMPNQVEFGNDQALTIRNDGLSAIPRTVGPSFTPEQITSFAKKFVNTEYSTLLDKYKYIIRDMNAGDFQSQRMRIKATGNELLQDYFQYETSTKTQLDTFCSEVQESMQDTLFDILITAGVNVDQFM